MENTETTIVGAVPKNAYYMTVLRQNWPKLKPYFEQVAKTSGRFLKRKVVECIMEGVDYKRERMRGGRTTGFMVLKYLLEDDWHVIEQTSKGTYKLDQGCLRTMEEKLAIDFQPANRVRWETYEGAQFLEGRKNDVLLFLETQKTVTSGDLKKHFKIDAPGLAAHVTAKLCDLKVLVKFAKVGGQISYTVNTKRLGVLTGQPISGILLPHEKTIQQSPEVTPDSFEKELLKMRN